MDHVAIFVDAGYLFAQGSAALNGSKVARPEIILDHQAAVDAFKTLVASRCSDCRLLRIYWYDGAAGARRTPDQEVLAHLDDVKLRLGFINTHGQQKGVDSLIVTDMIELARLKSISDAILMSGDEDVRIGVQIAQNYGVRVHLVGIAPCRGSQSLQLMQEADTTLEWDAQKVSTFLTVRTDALAVAVAVPRIPPLQQAIASPVPTAAEVLSSAADDRPYLTSVITEIVDALEAPELESIKVFWQTQRGVPRDMDRKMLPKLRVAIGRDLERPEITFTREKFKSLVQTKIGAP